MPSMPGCCCGEQWSMSVICQPRFRYCLGTSPLGSTTQTPIVWSRIWFRVRMVQASPVGGDSTSCGTTRHTTLCSPRMASLKATRFTVRSWRRTCPNNSERSYGQWRSSVGQLPGETRWSFALESGLVFGTPLVQFWPNRMACGRVALVGDAAHAASPMVGGGFRQGLYDAATLSTGVEEGGALVVQDVLDSYERQRLAPARAHVERSKEATEQYLERRQA